MQRGFLFAVCKQDPLHVVFHETRVPCIMVIDYSDEEGDTRMKLLRNLKFRTKIILVCVLILLFNSVVSGTLYYNYAFKDTLRNYYESSEDMVSQMKNYLANETQSITKRVHAIYNNQSFYIPMANYLRDPKSVNYAKMLGDVADVITELHQGDRYIQSVYFHTAYGAFDNFTMIRDRSFQFEESGMYRFFEEDPTRSIGWFPAVKSPVFVSNETVIPLVYCFRIERKPLYIVICLRQSEIEDYLERTYSSYDKVFIADKDGNNILNCGDEERKVLREFSEEEKANKNSLCKEIEYDGQRYLATYTHMAGTNWNICALRSAESLVGNLEDLRNFIEVIVCVCALISIAVIILVAHAVTVPLGQLAEIMNRVTTEDFKVQFPYPYKDEVGKLAGSFNYMIRKIDQLIGELNVNIEALKEEKERVRDVEMQKRKAELRALQAQINPHFLYNTLNAITWQAADCGAREVSILSNCLGKFFRISLSRGREIITLREELEHVTSYLSIQKIRYKDKMKFELDVPEDVKELYITKLVLQPLVENSIYHGIKLKEGVGTIRISVRRQDCSQTVPTLEICVEDDGEGIEEETLAVINEGLRRGEINRDSGYGIYNVNERLKLTYGDSYGLKLESSYKNWTRAVMIIPIRTTQEEV